MYYYFVLCFGKLTVTLFDKVLYVFNILTKFYDTLYEMSVIELSLGCVNVPNDGLGREGGGGPCLSFAEKLII